MSGAGGRVPDPYGAVVAAAGQQGAAVQGEGAHGIDPAGVPSTRTACPVLVAGSQIRTAPSLPPLASMVRPCKVKAHTALTRASVAFQDGSFGVRAGCCPGRPVGRGRIVGGVVVPEILGRDAKHGRPSGRVGNDSARSQPQQTRPLAACLGAGAIGEGDQAAQISMEQIGVIGKQVVDHVGRRRVGRQGAQQVTRCMLPAMLPADDGKGPGECPLVLIWCGDM